MSLPDHGNWSQFPFMTKLVEESRFGLLYQQLCYIDDSCVYYVVPKIHRYTLDEVYIFDSVDAAHTFLYSFDFFVQYAYDKGVFTNDSQ